MAHDSTVGGSKRRISWRTIGWSIALLMLLAPLVAMQFSAEVVWDETDFITFGAMIIMVGGAFEAAARMTGSAAARAASGVALVAAFLLVWINLAVGVIGTEDNPLNLLYAGVLAVGVAGAVVARFEPLGMARALTVTAAAQLLVGIIALAADYFTLILDGFFAALWLVSAALFRKAAREQAAQGQPSA